MNFRLGELFCGAGGMAHGILSSCDDDGFYGVTHTWSSDFDKDSCETYIQNICPSQRNSVICEDVHSLDIDALEDIDAFAYGFPCNSFSSVGEHRGVSDIVHGNLYYYGVKVLRRFNPVWFIAENVSGLCSLNDDFRKILTDLQNEGYILTPHLYKSEQYGIPQTRHRVIIVGIRNDVRTEFKVPSPEPYKEIDISACTALSNIPYMSPNSFIRPLKPKIIRRLSLIRPGENIWQAEERLGEDFPEDLKIHTRTKISQIYRKLDPNKPSYTVTAAGGGGTFMYHWTDRELSNRERARLQTFPDTYEFYGDYKSVRKQIGMAVPCKLANIITTAILNCFSGITYPSIKPNLI